MTVAARHVLAHLELLGDAAGHVLKRQFHLEPQVAAAVDALLIAAATAEPESAEPAAVAAEDVAEHGENVVHVHAGTAAEPAESAALRAVEAELVVLLTLLGVVQHLVSLGGLLECLLGCLVAGVAVGVVFDGQLAVGLLDVVFRGVLGDAQYLVVISFLCHGCSVSACVA